MVLESLDKSTESSKHLRRILKCLCLKQSNACLSSCMFKPNEKKLYELLLRRFYVGPSIWWRRKWLRIMYSHARVNAITMHAKCANYVCTCFALTMQLLIVGSNKKINFFLIRLGERSTGVMICKNQLITVYQHNRATREVFLAVIQSIQFWTTHDSKVGIFDLRWVGRTFNTQIAKTFSLISWWKMYKNFL